MKPIKQILFIILLSLSLTAVALPPDIQVDMYLVRAEQAIKNKNYTEVAKAMDNALALQEKHNLHRSDEFYFKYAKTLNQSKQYLKAFESINLYLTKIGKKGNHYQDALVLFENIMNAKSENGNTILHDAIKDNKNLEVIKFIIAEGADVNTKNKDGNTALHFAAEYNKNPEVIKLLIAAGADVNTKIGDIDTVLHYAVRYNKNLEVIKLLIAEGADVNAKDRVGWTALHCAATSDNRTPEVIKLLIAAGADVNAKDEDGLTALYFAKRYGNTPEFINLLR